MAGINNYETAKTCVFWDINGFELPEDFNPWFISRNIKRSLAAADYLGPITISAFGDPGLVNDRVRKAISYSTINFEWAPSDKLCMHIILDMFNRAFLRRGPENFFLISGNHSFSYALQQLRMRRINILLCLPQNGPHVLADAAETVWSWSDLLAGGPPTWSDLSSSSSSNGVQIFD